VGVVQLMPAAFRDFCVPWKEVRRANQNALDKVLFNFCSPSNKDSGVMHHIRVTAEYNTFDARAT
jgi:hypothetical protein